MRIIHAGDDQKDVTMDKFQAALHSIGIVLTTYMCGRALSTGGQQAGLGILKDLKPAWSCRGFTHH